MVPRGPRGITTSFARVTTDPFHENIEVQLLFDRFVTFADEIRKLVGGELRAHCGVVLQQDFVVHS